jgi:hypothetical protein
MIRRTIQDTIKTYLTEHPASPILLTGAKGTGKTTLALEIGKSYHQMIVVDLETYIDRKIFENADSFDQIVQAIFFIRNKSMLERKTLVFLREIQHCPRALSWLTQSYATPQHYTIIASTSYISPVIAAILKQSAVIPSVYKIPPLTFHEFLHATNDPEALAAFEEVPVPIYAYEKLLNYFHLYSLIGGMPEIVSGYIANHDMKSLSKVYETIFNAFEKCIISQGRSSKISNRIIEILQNSFPYAATRIIYHHFGNSSHQSREIASAFRTLEKYMLLQLVYPTTSTSSKTDIAQLKSPRLQMVDTGLVNYFSGIQKPLLQSHDMNAIFEGQIAKHVVGQEIAATEPQSDLIFWIRNKNQSTAEIDFVIHYQDMIVPVIVKSGEPGRLRSLHQYIDEAPHPYAVRLSAEKLSIRQAQTIKGKKYYLLNLPYFLASKITIHLQGFIRLTTS